ncbi:hypothetical protein CYMTET_6068 [Cymbomonas tetramitiformis]|uniref:Uncharacterized protein n=1 Tax=Cymbomonas tetramitiformis TaxID=36881 RepID=A0AAE0GXW2_9CHLO|nr:hypothetical protein CYMTET_6068 [Cymbomonas tetramitiformis]
MPLTIDVNTLLEPVGKLSRFKLGSTAAALQHQKLILEGVKPILPWFRALSQGRQEAMLKVVVENTALLFKANGQRLLLGVTVAIPPQNATAVQAGVIRKCFLAVGRVLVAADKLATSWDEEDEKDEDMEEEDDDEEEERDSPPKRRRPTPEPMDRGHRSKKKKKKGMLPPSVRRRAKAVAATRKAYRATMLLAKALEAVPRAFGDELEWDIRPGACPAVAAASDSLDDVSTLEDLEEATSCTTEQLEAYTTFLRGSAVLWHAHLRKCPGVKVESLPDPRKEDWLNAVSNVAKGLFADHPVDVVCGGPTNDSIGKQPAVMKAADNAFHGDFYAAEGVKHASGAIGNPSVQPGPLQGLNLALPQPVEAAQPEYREMFQTQDGRVLTRPPKQYTKEEFSYRLLHFAREMPDGYEREVHYYHMYVLDLFARMDSHDVKCVAEYDKYIRQRMASGFILSWNPDMLQATWTRFVTARKESGLETTKSTSKVRDTGASSSPQSTSKIFSCFPWNAGKCSKKNCKFPHVCSSCGSSDHKKKDKACAGDIEHRGLDDRIRTSEVEASPRRERSREREPTRDASWGVPVTELQADTRVSAEERVDRWAMVFGRDQCADALRVAPIPEEFVCATHGVGVVDKDHSNFEKVRVVHNYSENLSSVNSATDIPQQKWQSVTDALALGFSATVGFLDDFWVCAPWEEAQQALLLLQDLLEFLGLPVAWDKCEGPVCDVIFLGVRICTDEDGEGRVSASLPTHKNGGFLDGKYFAVSWPELLAGPQQDFYPFKDRASSQINYLELFSVYWGLSLWGEELRGLTVVLITDDTPSKGMLEKWRCTPDFRKLLRKIFKQCVQFDVRFIVEWAPSKENQFADALSRKEMQLFFELYKDWQAASIWRQDRDDWKLFAEVFDRPDFRFGPFSVDACSDAFGANKETLECWTVRQDCTTQDWAGHTVWCNPPFSRILAILLHFLECKKRQNVGTSACFVILVWPTADFYKFIVARFSVFFPVERKANITAKKQGAFSRSGVMLRRSVRFVGKDQMEVVATASKTNQFAEREHKVLFKTVKYTAFCAVTFTRKAFAANMLPVDEYHEMSLEQRLAIPKLVSESMAAAVEAKC